MAFWDKLLSFAGIEGMKITLNGEEREGGFLFITSPELKGFSLLLEPGKYEDLKAFIDAVYNPLTAYMMAYQTARFSAQRHETLRLCSTKITEGHPLVAKMCFQ